MERKIIILVVRSKQKMRSSKHFIVIVIYSMHYHLSIKQLNQASMYDSLLTASKVISCVRFNSSVTLKTWRNLQMKVILWIFPSLPHPINLIYQSLPSCPLWLFCPILLCHLLLGFHFLSRTKFTFGLKTSIWHVSKLMYLVKSISLWIQWLKWNWKWCQESKRV